MPCIGRQCGGADTHHHPSHWLPLDGPLAAPWQSRPTPRIGRQDVQQTGVKKFIHVLYLLQWQYVLILYLGLFPADPSTSLPFLARFGSRGNCDSMVSDASAFEIYAFYNVNTDPYKTISAVRERVMRKIWFTWMEIKVAKFPFWIPNLHFEWFRIEVAVKGLVTLRRFFVLPIN